MVGVDCDYAAAGSVKDRSQLQRAAGESCDNRDRVKGVSSRGFVKTGHGDSLEATRDDASF